MKLLVSQAVVLLVLACVQANPISVVRSSLELPAEVEQNPIANLNITAETINNMTVIVAKIVNINNGDGSVDVENPETTTAPPPVETTTEVWPGTTVTGEPSTTTITTITTDTTASTTQGPILTPPPIGRK